MKKTGSMILTALPVTLLLSFYCCAAYDNPAEEFGQLTKSLHHMQFIVAAIVIAATLHSIMLIAGLFLFIKKRAAKRNRAILARNAPPRPSRAAPAKSPKPYAGGKLPHPPRARVPCERVSLCPNYGFESCIAIPIKVEGICTGRVTERKLSIEDFIAEVRRTANAASEATPDTSPDIQATADIAPNESVIEPHEAAEPETSEAAPAHDAATCSIFAEALRHVTGADISLINCGGIRGTVDIESCTETDILRIFPFDDIVTVLGLTATQLRAVLEHSAALLPGQNGRYLYMSGITAEPDASMPIGERVDSVKLPNNVVSGGEAEYIVAVNDYIANGGDGYDMLAALPKMTEGQTVVQAVLEYISEVGAEAAQNTKSIQLMNAH